jgi:hypothetical protein
MSDFICNVAIWKGLNNRIKYIENVDLATAFDMARTFQKKARRFIVDNELDGKNIIYSATEHDEITDAGATVHLFKDTVITDEEVYVLPNKIPNAIFGVIHSAHLKTIKRICKGENSLHVADTTLDAANDFLKANNQKGSYSFGKGDRRLAISLKSKDERIVGVAMCGLHKKSGDFELRRLYTNGDKDSAWKLYNTCIQIAKDFGYKTVVNLNSNFNWISGDVPDMVTIHENCTEKERYIAPIPLSVANDFVKKYHRHNDERKIHKFSLGLYKKSEDKDILIGVAICGSPTGISYNGKSFLEVYRVCVTEANNSCSMLYGRCTRIAKELGYEKLITYTLKTEPGTTVKASGFELETDEAGGKKWTGKRAKEREKKRNEAGIVLKLPPEEKKNRWAKLLTA